jgi:hypothetical protein
MKKSMQQIKKRKTVGFHSAGQNLSEDEMEHRNKEKV